MSAAVVTGIYGGEIMNTETKSGRGFWIQVISTDDAQEFFTPNCAATLRTGSHAWGICMAQKALHLYLPPSVCVIHH